MKEIEQSNIPLHLGLILDGNRRWAKGKGMSLADGYKHTYFNLKKISEAAFDSGIKYLSAFVLSTENWNRPPEEIKVYMNLLGWVLTHEVNELHKKNIRIRVLGASAPLDDQILKSIHDAEDKTASNARGTLALCLNYGGQREIADVIRRMIEAGVSSEEITTERISGFLYAPDIPPLDLIIRTSGEKRLSGFMLWRSTYSELLFIDKNFPDFTEADLDEALAEYASRQRRFGQ